MISELIQKVQESLVFKEKFIAGTYLSHIFIMPPVNAKLDTTKNLLDLPTTEFHAGFYNPTTRKVAVFKYLNGGVSYLPEDEVFQKDDAHIPELDISQVHVSLQKTYHILLSLIKEKYQGAMPLKLMIVLQNLPPHGLIWNITLLRGDFKTLNVKIDAQKGIIIEESLASLISK